MTVPSFRANDRRHGRGAQSLKHVVRGRGEDCVDVADAVKRTWPAAQNADSATAITLHGLDNVEQGDLRRWFGDAVSAEIGRASCRERVL